MNGEIITVVTFSLHELEFLAIVIDGILHPTPVMILMIALPLNPKRLNILSNTIPTLERIPTCSKIPISKERVKIHGKNPMTVKIPPKIPSLTNDAHQLS